MSDKAIIIAANSIYGEGGNVETHKRYAENNGKVFWYLVPPGRRDIPWANPDIKKGYFYISGTGEVKYKFLIDDARRISDFKNSNLENKVTKYIPEFRQYTWNDPDRNYFYALLIRNISRIDPGIPLYKFRLVNTGSPAQRVMNYIIVYDRAVL